MQCWILCFAQSTLIKLWAPLFFTRERLSDDLRLIVVVSNKAFGVDLGTAVPEGQVTRIFVEVIGIIVDRLLGHLPYSLLICLSGFG